jgi:hypothetical protein
VSESGSSGASLRATNESSTASRLAVGAVVLGILLVLVLGAPRFAASRGVDESEVRLTPNPDGWFMEHDRGVPLDRYSFDTYSYTASVSYFRGEFDRYPIYGPWRWRLLPSWIAARLPIDNPAVAFAVVSLTFLCAGVAALVHAAARFGMQRRGQYAVAALFALSFPVFWYGTSGYVDGSVVALMCVALALVHGRKWTWFLALIPFGMATKETFVIAVPVAVASAWTHGMSRGRFRTFALSAAALSIGTFVILRLALPTPRTLGWMPDPDRLGWNLTRPEALGSFVLTCGLVVPLALAQVAECDLERYKGGRGAWRAQSHLVVGLGLGLLVGVHGFLTAYADGRHAWTAYPWGVLLAALLLTTRRGPRVVVLPAPDGDPSPGPLRTTTLDERRSGSATSPVSARPRTG